MKPNDVHKVKNDWYILYSTSQGTPSVPFFINLVQNSYNENNLNSYTVVCFKWSETWGASCKWFLEYLNFNSICWNMTHSEMTRKV